MTLLSIIALAILGVCIAGFWRMMSVQSTGGDQSRLIEENASLKAQVERFLQDIGMVKSELEAERTQRNEMQGKNKQLFASGIKSDNRIEALTTENDQLKKQIAKHDAEHKLQEREFQNRLKSLEAAEQSLKEERQRVMREEEQKRALDRAEWDKMWTEHEVNVIASLTDLCKQPQFNFTNFSNTNLPDEFSGSLKPDFMIEFLGQYIIFDAKVSKAESLQTYINDTVKRTAEKVKKNAKIFPVIFLVVPTNAIAELSHTYYVRDEYSFYIISPEAMAPILWSLKRITHYELAEQMDPQQRENIVNLIADLDYHINWRNAMDIVMTKLGADLLQRVQKLDPQISAEVGQKKLEKKPPVPTASELKRILASISVQNEEIDQLASPKAAVSDQDIRMIEMVVKERAAMM